MNDEVPEFKAALRRQIRTAVERIPAVARADASARARERLKAQPCWRDAGRVLLFAPLPSEPDLWPLLADGLAAGKTVALPRFSASARTYEAAQLHDPERELRTGRFGIREPLEHCAEVPLDRLDLVLVPGVAFDLQGRRLGRGKGFYDRLLSAVRGTKCGVAFDEQIVGEVPSGPLDIRVDYLLTPARWVAARVGD